MACIRWQDSFSVNIKEIDLQHQRLVKLINDLDDAMRVGKGKALLNQLIVELFKYTQEHFATEERYFDKFGYPEAAAHKQEHRQFLTKVNNFSEKYLANQLGLSIEIMSFLSDWLQNHIQGSDKKYAPYLIKNGLK